MRPWYFCGKAALDWLYKISITCFAASYLVVFGLEVSRVFFQAGLRKYIRLGFAAAGLFAHTVYLIMQGKLELDATGIWLSSWSGWSLAAAWLMALAYFWISVRQSKSVIGLFLLPVVMILIAVGIRLDGGAAFSVGRVKSIWSMVHSSTLLLGTAIVALGFVFGVVYLIQASRLKRKIVASKLFRLPSLEWLQRSSEVSLIASTLLLGGGLISGIALNLVNQAAHAEVSTGTIAWSDPVVWSSGVLFLWLLSAALFNVFYQPARQGRKVAYLVMTSFLFLVLELGIVWWVGHAVDDPISDIAKVTFVDTKYHFKTQVRSTGFSREPAHFHLEANTVQSTSSISSSCPVKPVPSTRPGGAVFDSSGQKRAYDMSTRDVARKPRDKVHAKFPSPRRSEIVSRYLVSGLTPRANQVDSSGVKNKSRLNCIGLQALLQTKRPLVEVRS